MAKKISSDPTIIAEVKNFVSTFLSYCQQAGVNPEVALAVMLFESGSTLNSKFYSDAGGAFGFGQFTKEFAQTRQLLRELGAADVTYENVTTKGVAYFEALKSQNRMQHLKTWFVYTNFYKNTNPNSKGNYEKFAKINKYLPQYQLWLNPNANPDRKDGNGVSAAQITSGQGRTATTWNACVKLADDLLSGKEPWPGEDSSFGGRITLATAPAYHNRVGYVFLKSAETGASQSANQSATLTPPAADSSSAAAAKPNLSETLPVEISISIPEYPKLVGLKPGDVIILPQTSQLRDWLITSVERTFNNGLNILSISGRRPLSPAPFVQPELLARIVQRPMSYYYLQ